MDGSSDYERVFKEMERNKICLRNALLYESFALFLEVKGKLIDACMIYHLGISRLLTCPNESNVGIYCCFFVIIVDEIRAFMGSRNAQPLGRLKKAQVFFLERMSERVTNGSFQKVCVDELCPFQMVFISNIFDF